MRHANRWRLLSVAAVALVTLVGTAGSARAQDKPRYGGELQFVVPSEMPSYDGHREETFGLIHPTAPALQHAAARGPLRQDGHEARGRPGGVVDRRQGRADLHLQAPLRA